MHVMGLQPPLPLAIGCPVKESHGHFPLCLPRADTDASGGDAITKGFIRGKKYERDGAVVRDACSMLQPQLSAVSMD